MFIGGLPGAGKTTCQHYHMLQFRPVQLEHGSVSQPILRARVPSKASDKTLVTQLLRCIGDVLAEKGSAANQTSRLEYYIKKKEVELCHIDEFQHFVDKDSAKVQKNVSSWLKNLIDETGKPFVLWGMPYADRILDVFGNEQLRRRITVKESLDPFGWSNPADLKEFRSFLLALDRQLPLANQSGLSEMTMAFRFYCATNGRVGYVMKIVRRAAELAIRNSMPSLSLSVLAEAYKDRMMPHYPNRDNPFSINPKDLKATPFDEVVPELTGNRLIVRDYLERASEVLHK
jgi:hypothetical protein